MEKRMIAKTTTDILHYYKVSCDNANNDTEYQKMANELWLPVEKVKEVLKGIKLDYLQGVADGLKEKIKEVQKEKTVDTW